MKRHYIQSETLCPPARRLVKPACRQAGIRIRRAVQSNKSAIKIRDPAYHNVRTASKKVLEQPENRWLESGTGYFISLKNSYKQLRIENLPASFLLQMSQVPI